MMFAKYIGDSNGDYVNDRNYTLWIPGKGYEIKVTRETVRGRRRKSAKMIVVRDSKTGMERAYDDENAFHEEWEVC